MTDVTEWHRYVPVDLDPPASPDDDADASFLQLLAAILFVFSGPLVVAAVTAFYILKHGEF